jgi:hypothetical protein
MFVFAVLNATVFFLFFVTLSIGRFGTQNRKTNLDLTKTKQYAVFHDVYWANLNTGRVHD